MYEARFRAREMARALGFDVYDQAAIETAVSELATNILRHAGRGFVVVSPFPPTGKPLGLAVLARNAVASPAQPVPGVFRPAFRPSGAEGLGVGLEGCRRLMDELSVDWVEGCFQVTARKWLAAFRPPGGRAGSLPHPQGAAAGRFEVEAAVQSWQPGSCGDAHLVREMDGDLVVLVVDVLGHGEEASRLADDVHETAGRALDSVQGMAPDRLLRLLGERLRHTRGACALAVRVAGSGRLVEWSGLGSVRARLWQAGSPRELALTTVPGVLGYHDARIRLCEAQVTPPACLAVVSDGLDEACLFEEPKSGAQQLLRRFASGRDDATAVVVRWQP